MLSEIGTILISIIPLYWALCDVQGVDPTTGRTCEIRSGRAEFGHVLQIDEIHQSTICTFETPCGNFWLAHLQQAGSRKLILVRLNLL